MGLGVRKLLFRRARVLYEQYAVAKTALVQITTSADGRRTDGQNGRGRDLGRTWRDVGSARTWTDGTDGMDGTDVYGPDGRGVCGQTGVDGNERMGRTGLTGLTDT